MSDCGRGCVETHSAHEYAELGRSTAHSRDRTRPSGHRRNSQTDLRGESAIARAHAPANCIAFIVLTNPNTFITRLKL
jgi:hypothetical protein